MTVAELENRMSVAEFFDWMALANIEAEQQGDTPRANQFPPLQ